MISMFISLRMFRIFIHKGCRQTTAMDIEAEENLTQTHYM
jgi:hypothetical protein